MGQYLSSVTPGGESTKTSSTTETHHHSRRRHRTGNKSSSRSTSSHRVTKHTGKAPNKSTSKSSRRSRTHKVHRGPLSQLAHDLKRLDKKRINKRIMDGEVVMGFYKNVHDTIMYLNKPIEGASNVGGKFTELGNRWAKDAFNVYYAGDKVEGATASTFKVLGGKYATDKFTVYYGDEKTKMSPSGFKYLGDGYAKDTFGGLYHKGESTSKNPFNF